ncbi:MAG: hypothetical protein WC752_03485 [Patescibacteria group bacterium]|jgi:hypothetical protein
MFRFVQMVTLLLGWHIFRQRQWPFIFVVYPGTPEDTKGYFPAWTIGIAKRIFPTVFPLGFIGGGLYFGTMISTQQAEAEPSEAARLYGALRYTAARISSETKVAIAGRMPGILARHGHDMNAHPFVDGVRGTIHTISQGVHMVYARHEIHRMKQLAVVGGGGYSGSRLIERLKELGYQNIVALDQRFKEEQYDGGVTRTSDPSRLEKCQVVVVLTAEGEQFESCVPHLAKGTKVLDDTHPQIPSWLCELVRARGCHLYKVAISLPGFAFSPALPGYKANWLPGCVWEAVVTVAANGNGRNGFQDMGEFAEIAAHLGFIPLLVAHYDNVREKKAEKP